tara:strand:+ start:958 stop:2808 length:1851 start_codon:yes stop_codon:yes gene_type:complete
MIGTVEIYRNFGKPDQSLVAKENNLVVNGAGETICNLLTTPSAVVSAVPGLSDASNYTIQALSLGKSSEAYKENAHFHPVYLSGYAIPSTRYHDYVSAVKYDNRLRAVSLLDENIQVTTSSYDPRRDPGTTPNVNDKQLEPNTGTALDSVSGQYHYMGSSIMQGRTHPVGHNLNKLSCNSNPNLLAYTNGPQTDLPLAYWTSANIATATLSGTHTGPFYGTSAYYVSSTYNTLGSLRQSSVNLWKTSFHDNVDHTISVYIKQPEFGNETSGFTMNISDKTGTAVAHIATFSLWDSTAGKHIPPVFSTGTNGILGSVTPVVSETSSTGWYRLEAYLEGLGTNATTVNGDQLDIQYTISNGAPTGGSLFMWGWQLEESYGATKYQAVSGTRPTFAEGGLEGDLFQGCYPHTSGTDYAILSSLEGINDFAHTLNIYTSGTYPKKAGTDHFFNSSSVRSMDSNGFIRAYNPSSTTAFEDGLPIYHKGITDPASGLIVSAANKQIVGAPGCLGFSGTGEVSAICTISSGDLGLANMYGGLFKLGLWTIDLEKTLSTTRLDGQPKAVPSFPLKFGAGYNKIVYKLFAEKSLTKNMGIIKDAGTVAGHEQYDDLTIVWRLNFI